MKKTMNLFLYLLMFQMAAAQEYDLFLCIGQSNMAGRGALTETVSDTLSNVFLLNGKGEFEKAVNPFNKYSTIRKDLKMQGVSPAYSFSKAVASVTGRKVGLVVNARGGSSILSWKKGAKDGYYEETLSRVKAAMAQGGVLKAVLWHQGESDVSRMEVYQEHLTELVTDLRKDLEMPDLFFVAGEIAEWGPNGDAIERNTAFNRLISRINEFIPNSACISSEDAYPLINRMDPHFDTDSQLILGERYAKAVLSHCYQLAFVPHEGGLRILFIGDSITDGAWAGGGTTTLKRNRWDLNHIYGSGYMYLCASHYQSKYPEKEYHFFNRGVGGHTLAHLEKRWEEDAIAMRPDVLSVLIGTNDVHHYLRSKNRTPFDFEDWEKRYRALLDRSLKANPKLKIVLGAPFAANTGSMHREDNFAIRDSMVRHCAAIVKKIAKEYNATYLPYNDLFDHLLKKCPTTKDTYWIWDGIHPTPAGHKQMAEMWIKKVKL